jgi:hypothetical protein
MRSLCLQKSVSYEAVSSFSFNARRQIVEDTIKFLFFQFFLHCLTLSKLELTLNYGTSVKVI